MKILITGVTGNVGKACKNYALQHEHEVDGIASKVNCDLRDWRTTHNLIWSNTMKGKYDLVIAAHGTQKKIDIGEADYRSYDHIVGGNLEGSLSLASALQDTDGIAPGGMIVFFSSIQATQPRRGRGLYAAAKAGIEGLTRAVAVESSEKQIRSVCLRLGQMTHQMKNVVFDESQAQELQKRCLLPWITPDEVAKFCFALYDLPTITGEIIEISSGQHLKVWE